ncbi:MAG: General secretion pathway protein G [candidate division TM6 bacterium GW2011_GWF2_37_49]|nr:MAG: General secretion pathway protein G [candidate division TM6 bacterium GW2011_GWF2_37_49]
MKIRNSQAFTMMELIIVIMIIGVIMSLVGPRVAKWWSQSEEFESKLKIQNIKAALNDYRMEFGTLPTTKEGLRALVENIRPNDEAYRKAEREGKFPFVAKGEEGITDKSGEPFIYHCPPEKNKGKFKFFEIMWVGKQGTEEEPTLTDGV